MINVILFSGKAGVGKTTSANLVQEYLRVLDYDSLVVPFALGIKVIAREFMGWDGKKDARGRKLLQVVGTEAGREYDKFVWAKYLFEKYLPTILIESPDPQFILVDDWRFLSEINYCDSKYPTTTIRIESPDREILKGTPEYNHPSETELPNPPSLLYDFVVENLGTKEELDSKLKDIISKILKGE